MFLMSPTKKKPDQELWEYLSASTPTRKTGPNVEAFIDRVSSLVLQQHVDQDRKAVHSQFCRPSYDALRAFTLRHGVSMTGLIDALGHRLGADVHTRTSELDPVLQGVVEAARRIDADRRARS